MASATTADGLFPEDEARPRAHVAAAFAALEHEAARSVAEVLVEQARRRHVQIGGDPLALELGGLVGAAAGEQSKRRAELAHDGQLLGAKLGGHEAEDAHAPGASGELSGGVAQQIPDFRFAQQREGQKGQAAPLAPRPGQSPATSLTRVIGPWRIG